MKTMLKVSAACLAVMAMAALPACKEHHGHDPGKLKSHVDSSLKKVGATEEQRAKIGAVSDQIIADGSGLCRANGGLGQEFAAGLLQDRPDRQWLHQTVDEKAKELTAFAHRTVDRLIQINEALTPEQRAKLKAGYEKAHAKK